MLQSVLVLGGGSAGLIAALTLKRRVPHLSLRVVRSPEIGIIGVGEGTTADFPRHFFQYLGLKPRQFYAEAAPTWKLGIRFQWGSSPDFFYAFSSEHDNRLTELPRNHGFYQGPNDRWIGRTSACMAQDRAFPKKKDGQPDFSAPHGFHIENIKLVAWLEGVCRAVGVEITEGTMREVEQGADGVAALLLESGERVTADLFVDASGFRSELLGVALKEPYISYGKSLFCDRAVIAGWPRTDEVIRPYTVAETMDSGWCWQIEHEHWINRGYVYSSRFITDDAARAEFLVKNPKIANEPRIVKFRSGRLARGWVGNVAAIGNAAGFVEPLEATALHVICAQSRWLADALLDAMPEFPAPSCVKIYNQFNAHFWEDIRDFLAVHYAFNARLDTPFWQACRSETDVAGAAPVIEFYRENGPSQLGKALLRENNSFGMHGFLAIFCGQHVAHARARHPKPEETKIWREYLSALGRDAARAFTVKQALEIIRAPSWKWP